MMGLARMAAQLAHMRVWKYECPGWMPTFSREDAFYQSSATAEYYRIIDRIARGEKP